MKAAVASTRDLALRLAAPLCTCRVLTVQERMADFIGLAEDSIRLPASMQTDSFMGRISVPVLTLGPALENEVAPFFRHGDRIRSLFVDAAGVALLDLAAREAVFSKARQDETLTGYAPCCYRQPGCEGIPMDIQTTLFNLVDAGAINVGLNESLSMTPAKSLSFRVEWSSNIDNAQDFNKCRNCSLQQCLFRRGKNDYEARRLYPD